MDTVRDLVNAIQIKLGLTELHRGVARGTPFGNE